MPIQVTLEGKVIENELQELSSHLRSQVLSEIISNKPSFLIRWGISIFLLVLLCIVAACWFIQYPDIVSTNTKLVSINAPKEIKTRTDGRLVQLFIKEGQAVNPNEILGFMESRANHKEVIALEGTIASMQSLLNAHQLKNLDSYLNSPLLQLGEVQQSYQTFIQAFAVFKQYINNGFYIKKQSMLKEDIAYLQRLHSLLFEQKNMQEEDLQLQQENFDANESLKKEKVISALDYRSEKSKLLSKKMSLPQINASITNNESSQHEKQKELAELDNQIMQQQAAFAQALNTFSAAMEEWDAKYIMRSPIKGRVSFASFLQKGQQLAANKTICFINPTGSEYYAEAYIPQAKFGKVKTGQKVMLKFPSYPYEEYGSLEGRLDFISNIPTDSGYLAKVHIPASLETNYKKQLQFREGLMAEGEIVTQNMNLLQRFFNQARSVFKKE